MLDDIPNLAFESAADAVAEAEAEADVVVVVLLVDHNQFHTITSAELGGKRSSTPSGSFR